MSTYRIDPAHLSMIATRFKRVERVAIKVGASAPTFTYKYVKDEAGNMWAEVAAPDMPPVQGRTGWTAVAVVTDGVIRQLDDRVPQDPSWREKECDECHTHRDRVHVWILERDGAVRRVGASCLDMYNVPNAAGLLAALDGFRADLEDVSYEKNEKERRSSALDLAVFWQMAWTLTEVYGYVAGGGTRDLLRQWLSGDPSINKEIEGYTGTPTELDVDALKVWATTLNGDFGDNVAAAIASAELGGVRREHHGYLCCLPHLYSRALEQEEAAKREPSSWLDGAEVKKRLTVEAQVLSVKARETDFGCSYLCTFLVAGQNLVFWRASNKPSFDVEETVSLTGTVKELAVWRDGTHVTVLTRCRVA